MSDDDDYRTPLPQLPVAGAGIPEVVDHRLRSVEVKFHDLKQLVDRNKDLLIETVGTSGRDGRIAVIIDRLDGVKKDIEEIQVLFEEQRKYIAKIVMAMLVTSGLGAGSAQLIMSLVSGG